MTEKRIMLYIANSYLYGFKIPDAEYTKIILYLKSLCDTKKDREKQKILRKLLGSFSSILTSKIIFDVLRKEVKYEKH